MAIGFGFGGTSGAGKGEIAEAFLKTARQRYQTGEVRLFDQGALYRMLTL